MAYFLLPRGANVGTIPIRMTQVDFLRQIISTNCERTFEVLDDNVEWWLSQCDASSQRITAEFAPNLEESVDDVSSPSEMIPIQSYNADYARMYAVLESAVNGSVARVSRNLVPTSVGFLTKAVNQQCFRHDINVDLCIQTFGETPDFQCYAEWLAELNSRSMRSLRTPNHLSAIKDQIDAQLLQETRSIGGTLAITEGSWLPIVPSDISAECGDFVFHIKSKAGPSWNAEVFTTDAVWQPSRGTTLTRNATVLINGKLRQANCTVGVIR